DLQQRYVLDRFRFDVLDAGDVEEVVLVVIGDESLHLRRVHAAVRLRDVDHRQVQVGEDVDRHARERETREEGDGQDEGDHRDGPTQGAGSEIGGIAHVVSYFTERRTTSR